MFSAPCLYFFFIQCAVVPKVVYLFLETRVQELNDYTLQFCHILLFIDTGKDIQQFVLSRIYS